MVPAICSPDAGFGHEAGGGVAEFVGVPVPVAEVLCCSGEGAGDVAWVVRGAVGGGEHKRAVIGGPGCLGGLALRVLALAVFLEDVGEWGGNVEAAAGAGGLESFVDDELLLFDLE